MSTNVQTDSSRSGGIDPVALAIATLAGVVTAIAPPGPYMPGAIMLGIRR